MKTMYHHKIQAEKAAIVVAFALTTSCTSYPIPSVSDKNLLTQNQPKHVEYADLTQILKRVPGINVNGNMGTAKITITRNIQFTATGEPLYVLNGLETGNMYAQVYHMVRVKDIKNIQVMNDAEALSTFGSRGKNGAIIIRTF